MNIEKYIEIIPFSGCWIWTGKIFPNGYGCIRVQRNGDRRSFMAHRVIYQEHKGQIPDGLDLDHLCRVKCCVNPNHLEPVTRRQNLDRAGIIETLRTISATKNLAKFCTKGHAMTPENTYTYPNSTHRACRECQRIYGRAWIRTNRKSRAA